MQEGAAANRNAKATDFKFSNYKVFTEKDLTRIEFGKRLELVSAGFLASMRSEFHMYVLSPMRTALTAKKTMIAA